MSELTFDQAMILTRTIGSHTTFEDPECEAYFNILMGLSFGAQIVEVGLEYGRSSSIALQVAKDKWLRYCAIDIAPKEEWFKKLTPIADFLGHRFTGFFGVSSVETPIIGIIDAILIDSDHSYDAVLHDCEYFLPYVRTNGYAMFHDYQRESIPSVEEAVDDYMSAHQKWIRSSVTGTLGIFRRLP
jgi:Methyltransferase domain